MRAFSVAVIAGGKSSRMGTDKSFVQLAGRPLIAHVIERVLPLGQAETLLVTNKLDAYAHLGLPMHSDVLPEKGSLGGIYTAIYHSQQPYTLCVACDMPFLNTDLLRYLVDLRKDDAFDVIAPRVADYPEGLHALYSRACLDPIRRRLEADQLKVIGFHADVRVRYVDEAEWKPFDPQGRSFRNINTPDELQQAAGSN
jgi:molybdopterin-guanine dinucleotide biosynthesis protein A